MTAVTLEQSIQKQLDLVRASSSSPLMPETIRAQIGYRELDIALSAFYLVQHTVGQNEIINWDDDLLGRIALFHQAIITMRDWDRQFQSLPVADFVIDVMHNRPPIDQELCRLLVQTVTVLDQQLRDIARSCARTGGIEVPSSTESLQPRPQPTKWQLVVAFTAVHALLAIVAQANQREILERIRQLEQAIEYRWQAKEC